MVLKIGLVRHFKVRQGFPEKIWVTPDELKQWFDGYDLADVEVGKSNLCGIDWKVCYTSDLYRAVRTAEIIYDGKIVQTELLREIPHPVFRHISRAKLPFLVWAILVRIAQRLSHRSCVETRADVQKRIGAALEQILLPGMDNVLIVSHGALMMEMRQELLRRGFHGPGFGSHPANGRLYVYDRAD